MKKFWFWLTTNKSCPWCGLVMRSRIWARRTTSAACPDCYRMTLHDLASRESKKNKDESETIYDPRPTIANLKPGGRGHLRNQKCICQSGKKFKHCCGKGGR